MTLVERRQKEKDQRRKNVINIASKLFFLKGYEKVSMDEIANEAEVSKATLYFYFNDKESLYFAIVNRGIKILKLIIAEETKRTQTDDLEICSIHKTFNRFIQEYPDYAQAYVYLRSRRFELSNKKVINNDAKDILEFTEELIQRAILETKACIENRIFRNDVNPVIVTVFNLLMNENILTMSSDLKNTLEAHGITVQQFYLEITNHANSAIMNREQANKNTET
jgi:AcrR family transcriptional regulator